MEQIVVHVQDKHKAHMLYELLTALDFVNVVTTSEQQDEESQSPFTDFFSFAGLWADRDISLHTIRQKAWPGHYL